MKWKICIGFVFITIALQAQLNVSNFIPYNSPEYLISDILLDVDAGSVASNVVYTNGLSNQIGYFNGVNSNLGMEEGIFLSTGGISLAVPGGQPSQNGINYQDPDLVTAMNEIGMGANGLNNTIVLEFDFVAGDDNVEFEYVFASKEYPNYTCSKYNDIFGFFLSGPGLNGPYSNGGVNIALVPDPDNTAVYTTTPVTINTINSGAVSPGAGNDELFCGNIDPDWQDYSVFFVSNLSESTVGFPGFTTVLKAKSEVECGESYHIKLAIADVSDGALNSAVFLKKGSFTAGVPLQVGLEEDGEYVICDHSITIDPGLSGGFGNVTYYWTHDGNQILTEQLTVEDPGTYTFTCFDECGSISRTIEVQIYTPLEIHIPDEILLCSDTVIVGDYSGGVAPYNTYWTKGTESWQGDALDLAFGVNGLYTFHVEDGCGKHYSEEMEVESADLLSVSVPTDKYLCEDSLILTAQVSGGYGEIIYYWEIHGVKYYDLDLTVYYENPGIATFHASDECGQTYKRKVLVETPGDYDDMVLEAKYSDLKLCQTDKFKPQIKLTGGAGYKNYFWYLNGILFSGAEDFIFSGEWLEIGELSTLELQIVDRCENEIWHKYRIYGANCFLPNAFSPNGDGTNDIFLLDLGSYNHGVQLDVFNRWGQYVFRSDQYERCMDDDGQCWKGYNMNTGKLCIQGIYYYRLRFLDGREFNGTVNLFR